MNDYPYTYAWGNNAKRATLKGRRCRLLATGTRNTVLVEFEDGERVTTSRRALRKQKPCARHLCPRLAGNKKETT